MSEKRNKSYGFLVRFLKPALLSEFCRQIGAMTGVGITLSKSLEILKNGTGDKRIRNLYKELQIQMERGNSFSNAMESMGVFPEIMINMFRAAEASGNLEEVANRLAEHYRKVHETENKIKTVTLYPKFLGLMSLVIVLIVFLVVVPTVEPLFRGMELPLVTRILLAFSSFAKEHGILLIVLLAVFTAGIRILFMTERAGVIRDWSALHIPVVGNLVKIICTARFARSQSSLYSSGLPMVESLEIASRTVGNKYLEKEFQKMIVKVQSGTALSRAIEEMDGLDRKLASVIHVGEETGMLDAMLDGIDDSYEKDADVAMTRLVSMVEPAMIVFMGIVIGVILLGIMVPMWSMYENLG